MFLSEKNSSARTARNPLPPKIASLLRESWWLALLAAALYLLLILYTYNKADPGWSHSANAVTIRNAGGVVGAYIADLLLAVFGLSAYWWIMFCSWCGGISPYRKRARNDRRFTRLRQPVLSSCSSAVADGGAALQPQGSVAVCAGRHAGRAGWRCAIQTRVSPGARWS